MRRSRECGATIREARGWVRARAVVGAAALAASLIAHGAPLPSPGDPHLAQVNVALDFHPDAETPPLTFDLFDSGSGIAHDAAVPEPDAPRAGLGHYVRVHAKIAPDLLARAFTQRVFGSYPEGERPPVAEHPRRPREVVDDFDATLLGRPLLHRIDPHRGGLRGNPRFVPGIPFTELDRRFLDDPRGRLVRVKIRLLYDHRDRVLYRFIHAAASLCLDPDQGYRVGDVIDLADTDSPLHAALGARAMDFTYGEVCGLVAPFPLAWNATYVGAFPAFSVLAWERPPGTARLIGLVAGQAHGANPVEVQAGRQYGGRWTPRTGRFDLEALLRRPTGQDQYPPSGAARSRAGTVPGAIDRAPLA